jgi:hypothetical protein
LFKGKNKPPKDWFVRFAPTIYSRAKVQSQAAKWKIGAKLLPFRRRDKALWGSMMSFLVRLRGVQGDFGSVVKESSSENSHNFRCALVQKRNLMFFMNGQLSDVL